MASVSSAETSPSLAAIVAAVDVELPQYRDQTSPDGMMTIVFTDIEGSTEMLEHLGEESWLEVIRRHNRIVRDCVSAHGGEIVKSQGDGFMVVFRSAASSLMCAVHLQRAFVRHNAGNPRQQLRVRIGMHTGNIFETDEDFLGRSVILAARITGRARGGEILVSDACRSYTEKLGRWRFGQPTELQLKGLASTERVYPLQWAAG
jgi:class 3 adenylate cyclase